MIKRRHKIIFTVLKPFFMAFLFIFHGYRAKPMLGLAKDESALILSNHNGALDPFYMALSFNRPISFVASDHIFRLGFISSLIKWLVNPIPIVKSQLDLAAIRLMRETVKDGGLVGLFPEGNRSFSGLTSYIAPSIGKLVKQLKCSLILYRIDGGYMTTPRWSRSLRRGKMYGDPISYIDAEELSKMSPDEIYQIIIDNLYVDAYEYQEEKMIPYRGFNLAEYLELVLFVCPNCRELDSLRSKGSKFSCQNCGYSVKYSKYGFFETLDEMSEAPKREGDFFETVLKWYDWQKEILEDIFIDRDLLTESIDKPIFKDDKQILVLTEKAKRSLVKGKGILSLYSDRLVFTKASNKGKSLEEDIVFDFSSLIKLSVHGPKTLQFASRDNKVWEVRSKSIRSAYKYILVFETIRNMKGETHGFFSI